MAAIVRWADRLCPPTQALAPVVKDLVEISEQVQRLISGEDVDGVLGRFTFHDDRQSALDLQIKLQHLETYASNVQKYLTDQIDQPFYERLDRVGAQLEAMSIANYKTSNQIGFKKIEVIYSEAG